MARQRTLLIAEPDIEVARSLKTAFKDDFEVIVVKDGSKALEQSVLRYPDLILFDRHCPLIGATQFLRILRSNPRTEEIPLVILSDAAIAASSMPGFLQGVLVKPLNMDEVRSHVATVLRKVDAVKEVGVGHEDGAVSGSLEQISMPDLLQIFSVNRRSGSLQLTSATDRQTAEVFVHDGRIEEALLGNTRAEKALYRLLGWQQGRFAFMPGRRAPSVSLSSGTDSLLMEGMRQTDELERLRPEMPSPNAVLERLMPADSLPEGLHAVTAEIVSLVEFYPRVGDLVDKAKPADLEVYLALKSLLQAGYLRAVEAGPSKREDTLLSQEEVVDLRSRLRHAGLPPTYQNCPKVAVLAPEAAHLRSFAAGLAVIPGWQSADLEQLYRGGIGPLGSLQLDTGLAVQVYVVSIDHRLLPFTFGLSAGTVAALLLGTAGAERAARALAVLENERRASLLVARLGSEAPLEASSRRVDLVVESFVAEGAVRKVARTLLTQVAGRDNLRGGAL